MPIAKTIKRVANHIFPVMKNEQYSKVSQTNETEITFTRRGIALFSMKFRMAPTVYDSIATYIVAGNHETIKY